MSNYDPAAVKLFKQKAELVSTVVVERPGLAGAVDYALEVCLAKAPLQPVMETEGNPVPGKVLAAPALKDEDYQTLAKAAGAAGVGLCREGLRGCLAGIDMALTPADLGLAATATCVVACPGEDERLAAMVSEIQVMILPKSKVVMDLYEAEEYLQNLMAREAMYAAFISGSSRTSDIERVLTLGVHGPLELHVVLLDS